MIINTPENDIIVVAQVGSETIWIRSNNHLQYVYENYKDLTNPFLIISVNETTKKRILKYNYFGDIMIELFGENEVKEGKNTNKKDCGEEISLAEQISRRNHEIAKEPKILYEKQQTTPGNTGLLSNEHNTSTMLSTEFVDLPVYKPLAPILYYFNSLLHTTIFQAEARGEHVTIDTSGAEQIASFIIKKLVKDTTGSIPKQVTEKLSDLSKTILLNLATIDAKSQGSQEVIEQNILALIKITRPNEDPTVFDVAMTKLQQNGFITRAVNSEGKFASITNEGLKYASSLITNPTKRAANMYSQDIIDISQHDDFSYNQNDTESEYKTWHREFKNDKPKKAKGNDSSNYSEEEYDESDL